MTETPKDDDCACEVTHAEGMGMMLDDGGAVEVALIPQMGRVLVIIREPDGTAVQFLLTREAMDKIGELYVAQADAPGADQGPTVQ